MSFIYRYTWKTSTAYCVKIFTSWQTGYDISTTSYITIINLPPWTLL